MLATVGVAVGARIGGRQLLLAQLPFVGFGFGLVVVNALSRPGTVLLAELPVRIPVEGLVVGLALALRTLVIGVLSVGFLVSTPPQMLMTSLTQHARLSPRISYAMLAGYRLLHVLPQQWQTIRDAHTVRAPPEPARPTGLRAPRVRALSVRPARRLHPRGRADRAGPGSRGLGTDPRTTWRPVPLDRRDLLLVLGVLATVALVVVGRG